MIGTVASDLTESERATDARPDGHRPVALVTGGSSGIGRLLARSLAHRGFHVTAAARWESGGLPPIRDKGIHAIDVDVTDRDSMRDAVDDIESEAGPVDVLIASAGAFTTGRADCIDEADVGLMLSTNFEGVVNSCTSVVPRMIRRRRGAVVVIGSGWTLMPTAGVSGYAATKAAATVYALSLGMEIEQYGIVVSVLFPGYVANTGLARLARSQGLREPPAPLRTTSARLERALWSCLRRNRSGFVFVNPLERFSDCFRTLAPGPFHTIARRIQPFPAFVDHAS